MCRALAAFAATIELGENLELLQLQNPEPKHVMGAIAAGWAVAGLRGEA
jgi:hypothetical protein